MRRIKTVLAVALVACGIGAATAAISAPPASAHMLYSWTTMYNTSYNDAWYVCRNTPGNVCRGISYRNAFDHSADGRQYDWVLYFHNNASNRGIACSFTNRVGGHSNTIVYRNINVCWYG